jgi:hypothetical protein
MCATPSFRVAGQKTNTDWCAFRGKLIYGKDDPQLWRDAAKDYYDARLVTRYLDPIKAIKKIKRLSGEGFSIVTLQCSMIEFLESTVRGTSY